jgi:hypothetical protein
MSVHLRGHHLLCMLTYQGEGYSKAFIANFDKIIERISKGEAIELVEGADDICACLVEEKSDAHCFNESVVVRDAAAQRQIGEILPEFSQNKIFTLQPEQLKALRTAFSQNRIREACIGCEWQKLCTTIAEKGFHQVALQI